MKKRFFAAAALMLVVSLSAPVNAAPREYRDRSISPVTRLIQQIRTWLRIQTNDDLIRPPHP